MNKKTILTILAVIITAGLGVLIAFSSDSGKKEISKNTAGKGEVKREDAYYKGNKEAKVEIVEFSDLQCPACKMADPEIKKVLEFYGDKIVFYYRHFPLMQHKFSKQAASAAEAAGIQGKFWEMHDMIFANQSSLSEESFVEFAKNLGLDIAKFNADKAGSIVKEKIDKDTADAQGVGVNSTPTFFLNGEKVEGGGLTFEDWKTKIDEKLK